MGRYFLDQSKFEGIRIHSKPFELCLKGFDRFESVQTGILCCAAHVSAAASPAPIAGSHQLETSPPLSRAARPRPGSTARVLWLPPPPLCHAPNLSDTPPFRPLPQHAEPSPHSLSFLPQASALNPQGAPPPLYSSSAPNRSSLPCSHSIVPLVCFATGSRCRAHRNR
jgi:hypothetical protein